MRGDTLAAAALDGDFGENRHRDFLQRDGAEVEAGRRLELVERFTRNAGGETARRPFMISDMRLAGTRRASESAEADRPRASISPARRRPG